MRIDSPLSVAIPLPAHWQEHIRELTQHPDCCGDILSIQFLPASRQQAARLQIILFELSQPWLEQQRQWCQQHRLDPGFQVEVMSYSDFTDWLQHEPLSLLQLQQTGQVLYGDHLFDNLVVLPENLRQDLEKRLSAERFWFRERFLHSPSEALGSLLSEARARFALLEQGLIFLRSQSTTLPPRWLSSLYGLSPLPEQPVTGLDLQADLQHCWEWERYLSQLQQKLSQMFESGDRDTLSMLTL